MKKACKEIVNDTVQRVCAMHGGRQIAALTRLARYDIALVAWRKLEPKIDADEFEEIVRRIATKAIGAQLHQSEKKTQGEIEDAAIKAADTTKELIRLIETNATLRSFFRNDILSPIECAAMDRLEGALRAARTDHSGSTGNWFSADIEATLSETHERNFPGMQYMTTASAWKLVHVHYRYRYQQFFVEHLRNFAAFAQSSKEFPPVIDSPGAASASMHVFALTICRLLDDACGKPNHAIAAGLVSAVFDTDVDTQTIKDWWKRRGGIS